MNDDTQLLQRIRIQLRNDIMSQYREVLSLPSPETPYAVLLEISDQSPDIWPIVATEESLSRLADEHIAKGYTVEGTLDAHETIRSAIRWDEPGGNDTSWYGDLGAETELTTLLESAFTMPDDNRDLQLLALDILKELCDESLFGDAKERHVFIGITNVDNDFHEFFEDNSLLNPQSVIANYLHNMESEAPLWDTVKPPPNS